MSAQKFSAVPVFFVKKKYSWKDKLIRFLELGLIILVVLGTVGWILISTHFSVGNFVASTFTKLKPQVASKSAEPLTNEEKLKKILLDRSVLTVASITNVSNNFLEVHSADGSVIFFSLKKDFAEQVTTLQSLLAKAKIDNKSLKKADFRFSKIVVEY